MNDQELSVLEQRLRSEPPRFRTSIGFTERVMDGLPTRFSSRRNAHLASLWRVLGVGFAVAACMTFVLVQVLPARTGLPAGPALANGQSNIPIKIKLPEISVAQMQKLSAKLDEPLETELKNVISDTRQAIQFIASNFLPE